MRIILAIKVAATLSKSVAAIICFFQKLRVAFLAILWYVVLLQGGEAHGERPGVHGPRPECTETIPGRRLQAVRKGMARGTEGRELEVPADVPHRGVHEKEPKQGGLRHSYGAQGLQNDLDRYTGADHVHLSQRKKVQGKPSASSKIRERKF